MSSTYFDALADRWDETVAERDSSKLARLATRLDIKPGSSVLDVGTGTGVFVPFLLEKVGSAGQIVCLDYAEKMLEKARAKGFPKNVAYQCADILGTGLETSRFDAVLCYSSFPHFRDKPQACREMYRVLKPRGRLFICHTSSRDRINGIHSGIHHLANDLIPSEEIMRSVLESAGFREITVEEEMDSYLTTGVKL
jgi:ubiquinone/menaquinone biosynthesis C-methylase UbiE